MSLHTHRRDGKSYVGFENDPQQIVDRLGQLKQTNRRQQHVFVVAAMA